MRIPIVQHPRIVTDNLSWFRPEFATREQEKHFCEYVTGLIAGDKATVTAINGLFLNNNDQSALNRFMTQAKWDEEGVNRRRVAYEMARLGRRPVSAEAGRLILDDTLAHHTHCSMQGLAYLRDHSINRNVWAHNVVTSYYVNRSDQFPVDFRLYFQFNRKYEDEVLRQAVVQLRQRYGLESLRAYLLKLISYHYREQLYHPKTELAGKLVEQAVAWELPFSVVLFDSWFLRWPLIEAIQDAGKDWVGACPKDRLVLVDNQWVQISDYIATIPATDYRPYRIGSHLFWAFSQVLAMKPLNRQRVRIVASYEDEVKPDKTPHFYTTNRKEWEPKRILSTYLDRWPTETFNEDVKGNLGFEDYQLRQLTAIRRHWYLSFVAYSLLGDQAPPGRSRWAVRGQFQSTGQRCQAVVDELLGYLIHWVAQQLRLGLAPDRIIQRILT
ncbi:MAG: transposase [Caldilineaceae bacterium]